MIRFLNRESIDDKKWNGCVHYAINHYPYGYSWYLDNVAENWDGLVYGDYEMVFPLVWNKKYSIHYLYQPFFAQQLGVFSLKPISQDILIEFIEKIPDKFRFIDLNLNYMNPLVHQEFELEPRVNLFLDLDSDYETISKGYHENLRRNLKKASNNSLYIHNNAKPETVVSFFQNHTAPKIKGVRPSHFHTLHRIIYRAMHYGLGQTYGVYNDHNQLCASGFFLIGKNKIINLLPSVNEEGKKVNASAYLLDYIIRLNCGHRKVLDFEGSMIPSIAQFYRKFGASQMDYWRMKRNRLPWYLKPFKR